MAEILKNRIQFAVEGENKVITAQKKIADSAKNTAKSLEIFSKEVIRLKKGIDNLRKEAAGLRTDIRMLKEDNARLIKSNRLLTNSQIKYTKSVKNASTATKKHGGAQKALSKDQDITYRNNRNLLGSFSVLRSKILLASFAIGMIGRTLGKYVTAAADVEEVMNKFNVVFGDASAESLKFAQALGNQ